MNNSLRKETDQVNLCANKYITWQRALFSLSSTRKRNADRWQQYSTVGKEEFCEQRRQMFQNEMAKRDVNFDQVFDHLEKKGVKLCKLP